ncbi:MAG: hypothetical protein ABI905_00760 [Betaproteobacteria bacterium]
MQGCNDAPTPRRRPVATFLLPTLAFAAAAAFTIASAQTPVPVSTPAPATAPLIRDVQVRSFIGDPLNLRIVLPRLAEGDTSGVCQSVIDTDKRENALRSTDLSLTMVELRDLRYLEVRSRAAFKEPIARFTLRMGCPNETEKVVEKEFTVLIDPPLTTVLPVLPAAQSPASLPSNASNSTTQSPAKIVVPVSGTWAVIEGDTLSKLAKAIYPRNAARQRQYITVLRELNEELGNVADNAPLPAGTQLALPDLQTLSGITPGQTLRQAPRSASAAPITAPPAPTPPPRKSPEAAPASAVETQTTTPVRAAPAKPAPRTSTPAPRPATSTPVPAPVVEPKPVPPAAKNEIAKPAPAKVYPAKPVSKEKPAAKTEPANENFHLRLSNAQMDLTRSRNVSEAQRDVLREKQLILDSDDQVAALLSLKNTVKQLEQRLNEIQLKTSVTTGVPANKVAAAVPVQTPAVATSAPVASPAAAPPPVPLATTPPKVADPTAPVPLPTPAPAPATIEAVPSPQATPAPAVEAAAPAPAKPAGKPAPAKEPAPESSFEGLLPSPLVIGGILAGLALLIAAWAWSRRSHAAPADSNMLMRDFDGKNKDRANDNDKAGETVPPPSSQFRGQDDARAEAFAEWEGEPTGQHEEPAAAAAQPEPDHLATVRIDSEALQSAHHAVDAPVVFEDTPENYELDSNPATTVDFLVGMDEKLPEDRVRRLQYMHERYPELKSNTVSIDDADSVINSARLYYDESDKVNGADKAAELLTFAVEERPQQMRYWLALFEIFRLENMVSEFSTVASKFHVLFSHTPAWPKVRHIGHEMDPGNTLFAAGGTATLTADTRFDPIAENWLNAPVDFTSDALMSDLRLALLDDHGVSRSDFDSITARLSATAGAR